MAYWLFVCFSDHLQAKDHALIKFGYPRVSFKKALKVYYWGKTPLKKNLRIFATAYYMNQVYSINGFASEL